MRFKYFLLALFLFLLAGVFVYYNKRDLGLRTDQQIYAFSNLEKNQAALVRLRNTGVAAAEPYIILFEDILDEHYRSLVKKKEELMLVTALEQFALKAKNPILVGRSVLSRPVSEICNQYQFRCPQEKQLKFMGSQDYYLQVDGKNIQEKQIQQEALVLKAAQSEVLDYLLSKINEKLRTRLLYLLSKKEGLSVQDYIDQKIISDGKLREWSLKVGSAYSKDKAEKSAYSDLFYNQHKNKLINEFLIANHVQKPIVVNIQKPQFNFETRWDWTPFFGITPRKNTLHVILFYDYFSQASRDVLKMLLNYRDKKNNFTIGFRPVFNESDRMQRFFNEYLFCIWLQKADHFWTLLESWTSLRVDFTEPQLDKMAQEQGVDLTALKKCVIHRETKDIIDYHLKTAQYYRLTSFPAVFIGDEVHLGPLTSSEFEQILFRQ